MSQGIVLYAMFCFFFSPRGNYVALKCRTKTKKREFYTNWGCDVGTGFWLSPSVQLQSLNPNCWIYLFFLWLIWCAMWRETMPQLLGILKKKNTSNNYIYENRRGKKKCRPTRDRHASSVALGTAVSVCWSYLMTCHEILCRRSCSLEDEWKFVFL